MFEIGYNTILPNCRTIDKTFENIGALNIDKISQNNDGSFSSLRHYIPYNIYVIYKLANIPYEGYDEIM